MTSLLDLGRPDSNHVIIIPQRVVEGWTLAARSRLSYIAKASKLAGPSKDWWWRSKYCWLVIDCSFPFFGVGFNGELHDDGGKRFTKLFSVIIPAFGEASVSVAPKLDSGKKRQWSSSKLGSGKKRLWSSTSCVSPEKFEDMILAFMSLLESGTRGKIFAILPVVFVSMQRCGLGIFLVVGDGPSGEASGISFIGDARLPGCKGDKRPEMLGGNMDIVS